MSRIRTGTAIRRPHLVIAVLGAVVLFAAACGGDDSGGGEQSADTTTEVSAVPTSAPPTGSPLRIGLLVDQSGPVAPGQAEAVDITQAWVDETNTQGGLADHPVELVVTDTRGDAPAATAAAEEMIADESVIATLVVDASVESTFGPLLSEGGLPVVGGAGYFPTFWGAVPNVWGVATTFPSVVNEQAIAAESVGATVTAAAFCAENPSCEQANPIFEAATETVGLEYAGAVSIANDAPDFTAECLQFVNDEVDFVQLSASSSAGIRLADNCATQGYTGWFGASAGTVNPGLYAGQDTLRLAGGLNGFPWFVDAEPVQYFRDVMARQGVGEEVYGSPIMTATWASLELFGKVVEENADALGENPDRAGVIEAYGTVADETLDGLLPGPVTYTADQPTVPVDCFWLYTFEDGEFSGEFEPTCPGPEFD